MGLWRCLNCSTDFEAPRQACAACELDAAKDPRDADLIVKRETLHFDPPTKIKGRGKNHAACNPQWRVGCGKRFTGTPESVTCAACIATDVFQNANGEDNGVADLRVKPRTPKEG